MTEDWRKGYLTALNDCGDGVSSWKTGAFIAVQSEPYRVHSSNGMKFYLVLEEAREDRYTKEPYHRVYSVGVDRDGSQSGKCSDYAEFKVLVEGYDWTPLERFDRYHQEASSIFAKAYPHLQSGFPVIGQPHIYR